MKPKTVKASTGQTSASMGIAGPDGNTEYAQRCHALTFSGALSQMPPCAHPHVLRCMPFRSPPQLAVPHRPTAAASLPDPRKRGLGYEEVACPRATVVHVVVHLLRASAAAGSTIV